MTDREIIQALECSVKNKCPECPYFHSYPCDRCKKMQKDALDLIQRQQAEIERLQKENNQFADIGKMYSEIRAEAITAYMKTLEGKLALNTDISNFEYQSIIFDMEQGYKEMVGEQG